MTDDRILSAEEFDTFQVRTQADLDRLAASHEALRARLTAAEERARRNEVGWATAEANGVDARRNLRAAEAQVAALTTERDEALRAWADVETKLVDTTTLYDAALDALVTERDAARIGTGHMHEHWRERVTALTEALDTAVGMLHGFEEHVAASWAPHADYLFRQALADLDAALAAADQTDEGDK